MNKKTYNRIGAGLWSFMIGGGLAYAVITWWEKTINPSYTPNLLIFIPLMLCMFSVTGLMIMKLKNKQKVL